jgi:glutathione S-transferase
MARKLVALVYSPYSERARWALDHHALGYALVPYTPMIGEPGLRLRLRRFSGRVTVPVLFTDTNPITDSIDIVRYADRVGAGVPLIPKDHEAEILQWVEDADRALGAGRNLVTRRTAQSGAALMESLPPGLRRSGKLGELLARSGADFFMRKYGLYSRNEEADTSELERFLVAWRKALGGRDILLSTFSLADVVATCVLQIVSPVSNEYLRLGPATRDVWTTPSLKDAFSDLVAWRDDVYAKYRKKPSAAFTANT